MVPEDCALGLPQHPGARLVDPGQGCRAFRDRRLLIRDARRHVADRVRWGLGRRTRAGRRNPVSPEAHVTRSRAWVRSAVADHRSRSPRCTMLSTSTTPWSSTSTMTGDRRPESMERVAGFPGSS